MDIIMAIYRDGDMYLGLKLLYQRLTAVRRLQTTFEGEHLSRLIQLLAFHENQKSGTSVLLCLEIDKAFISAIAILCRQDAAYRSI